MYKFLCTLTFTIVSLVNGISSFAQFSDNFSDGDYTTSPSWSGSDKFGVFAGELKLQATAASGNAYLSTASQAIDDATWEFTVRLEFNPSSSNYARVYLTSDKADLSEPLNGYYVLIGGGDDEISLFSQSATTTTKIIAGKPGRVSLSVVVVRIKVTRDNKGKWLLFSDVGVTGEYISEGEVSDTTNPLSSFAGVYCVYTATRSDKFFFDDFIITGKPWIDNTVQPSVKDIIITEIFADPSPRVELPEVEFVEIYNRSSQEHNLAKWLITDGGPPAFLGDRVLKPGEYLILTSPASASSLSQYGNVMGVAGFPSLNNMGDMLILKAKDGLTIDSVSFTDEWYRDSEKKQGGWSLELIDLENPCGEEDNWTASENGAGGTPGRQNAVHANKPDLTGPELLRVFPLSALELKLVFNEKLSDVSPLPEHFILKPSIPIAAVSFHNRALREVRLILAEELKPGVPYNIQLQSIYDCSGNLVKPVMDQGVFGLPEEASTGDLLINEILFNPHPLGVDFVEVYNASSKFINLRNWMLANVDEDTPVNMKQITTTDFLLWPKAYVVFTSDAASLKGQYPAAPERTLFRTDLPSLPDDEGSIALLNANGTVIDYFFYSKAMHSPFIKNEEGISLERVSATGYSYDLQNWASAASGAGYATPGYVNSNTMPETAIMDDAIVISPEVFQPVSGSPAFTMIHYRFDQGGYVANVNIYDTQGRKIKQLANSALLGVEGFYRWDGDRDDGSKARTGYYIVWFEVFNSQGIVKTFRKRVVVASTF